jgi:molybdopterin converting factor subunit 1
MTVETLLFARYRDLAGTDHLTIQLPADATARDLIDVLRASGGGLASLPLQPAIAINLSYASLDTLLHEGDEIALIPPVSGG